VSAAEVRFRERTANNVRLGKCRGLNEAIPNLLLDVGKIRITDIQSGISTYSLPNTRQTINVAINCRATELSDKGNYISASIQPFIM
jgi:hypothetical protein